MRAVAEVVAEYVTDPAVRTALTAALIEREDEIADMIRLLGAQLGAMPEFVAKAIHDVGLGTPPTDDARAMVDRQFIARLAWLQEQFRQQGGQ